MSLHNQSIVFNNKMNWQSVYNLPTRDQIAASSKRCRSPYIAGWFEIPEDVRYTEYAVDFRAEHLPKGTYCCLGNWTMDYSSLNSRYTSISAEKGISGYAGFQNIDDGTKVSIMSFWDVYCRKPGGGTDLIRAKRVYPHVTQFSETFTGEGEGVHCTQVYEWKANHWYRMHLRCVTNPQTHNTMVEQWVCDLENDEYTLLCIYDIGVRNSAFKGGMAIFLENYLTEYAGEVRTLEVENPIYREESSGQWKKIKAITFYPNSSALPMDYRGGYRYGVSQNRVWMITDGVGRGTQGIERFQIE